MKWANWIVAGALTLAGLLAPETVRAQGCRPEYGGNGHGYGSNYGPRSRPGPAFGYGGFGPVPRGYSYGSSYYGGGRYGRPWGYSSFGGYLPGRGGYFGNSVSGRRFGYSSFNSYLR